MDDDRFIETYRPLVVKLAGQLHRTLSLGCEVEELIAFGFRGLLEARKRFDSSRGVQFNTFAYYRVRGAMVDGVRDMAYLPRRAYAKLRAAEAADQLTEDLGHTLYPPAGPTGRTPKEAAHEIDRTLTKLAASYVLASLGQGEEDAPADPERLVFHKARAEELRSAVEDLPDRERALVTGFYFEGRRFDEVANELGISKSWASRLHAKALERLREALAD